MQYSIAKAVILELLANTVCIHKSLRILVVVIVICEGSLAI